MSEDTKVKFCEKDSEGTVVLFKFGNGEVRSLDLDTLSDETKTNLMIHGALQKIGDSYAGAAGDYQFAISNVEKVMGNLEAGNFNAPRASGEAKPKTGELAEAIAALQGTEVAEAAALVEAMDDDTRKAVRAHPAVKAKIAELRAQKAAAAAAKAAAEGKGGFDLASLKAA
jgi:hypothetical protein